MARTKATRTPEEFEPIWDAEADAHDRARREELKRKAEKETIQKRVHQQMGREYKQKELVQLEEQYGLYRELVKEFDSNIPAQTASSARPSAKSLDVVVAARLRPPLAEMHELDQPCSVFVRPDSPGVIDAHSLCRSVLGRRSTIQTSTFELDHIYPPESSTESIYNDLVEPLLLSAWNGCLGTLFAHGQTGSGKTHTISNLQGYLCDDIFSGNLEGHRDVYLTVIELAGSKVRDLLDPSPLQIIRVLEDSFGDIQPHGASECKIDNKHAMMHSFDMASKLRHTSKTEKNPSSSRSHAVYRIKFANTLRSDLPYGVLYMVDLAGSEALSDNVKDEQRVKETREINDSLSTLKTCIRVKAEVNRSSKNLAKTPRVPYRQSTLTRVLKHVFDVTSQQTSKIAVMGCVNPCLNDVKFSKRTLSDVQMCRVLAPKVKSASLDPESPVTWNNDHLKTWITKNSGTPCVNATILAPHESGQQLLRLQASEFKRRCLETTGVTPEQANAFYTKLWFMHVDSKRLKSKLLHQVIHHASSIKDNGQPSPLASVQSKSSRDPNPEALEIPFKLRIRPGMVFHWVPPRDFPLQYPGENFAVVLCNATTLPPSTNDVFGNPCNQSTGDSDDETRGVSYLCALMTPGKGMTGQAYDLQLWQQVVVSTDSMIKEVIMIWDEHSRQYYIDI